MKRVLVVDDNHDNLWVIKFILTKILSDENISPKLVNSGIEAVKIAKGEDFHLILVDIRMPHMDGIEVIKTIRTMDRHKDTKILAMTADVVASKKDWQKIGADDILIMPDLLKQCAKKIKKLLK